MDEGKKLKIRDGIFLRKLKRKDRELFQSLKVVLFELATHKYAEDHRPDEVKKYSRALNYQLGRI